MSGLVIKSLADLKDDLQELCWKVGLECKSDGAWFLRVVFRGIESREVHVRSLPIGLLPMLTVGSVFQRGQLTGERSIGREISALVERVSTPDVVTSADIPEALYSFGGRPTGVQKILRYETDIGELLVPAVELVRYLFGHNRTLANALMRPNALEHLYFPQAPGRHDTLQLRFTREMPGRCLSHRFVKEFAWLAVDQEGRRSWDSVRNLSAGRPYVLLSPPEVGISRWRFRGVQNGNCTLVLEILHLSGRQLPASAIEYSHPGLTKIVRVPGRPGDTGSRGGGKDRQSDGGERQIERTYQLEDSAGTSQSDSQLKSLVRNDKSLDFENDAAVTAQRDIVERPKGKTRNGTGGKGGQGPKRKETIKVSAGEHAGGAPLPPIEFKLLAPLSTSEMGNLRALEATIQHIQELLPLARISMSLCRLKEGRAFSQVRGVPRAAMIVSIACGTHAPILLMDVERTWVPALSLVALRFRSASATALQIEDAARRMLDGLVDEGGHWCNTVEAQLVEVCSCERLPKLLVPRDAFESRAKVWALRLIEKLQLPA